MAAAAAALHPRWQRRPRAAASAAAFVSALFLVFAASLIVFSAAARGASAAAIPCKPSSLYARMKLDPELSDFAALLETVGYRRSLEDEQVPGGVGVTVLAPTNAALRAPPPQGAGGGGGSGARAKDSRAKDFNSSLALLSSVPAAARATVGGHVLRGAIGDPSRELSQGRWLRTLATAKRPGQADRGLGVSVASGGASGPPGTFTLKADAGATARASFVPADNGGCGGDALMKLDGVLWPF